MPENVVTGAEVQDMILHNLGTPPNGYLGNSYGADMRQMLQRPMSTSDGDDFIDKLRQDIPIVGALPAGEVNLYMQDSETRSDRKDLLISVAGEIVALKDALVG